MLGDSDSERWISITRTCTVCNNNTVVTNSNLLPDLTRRFLQSFQGPGDQNGINTTGGIALVAKGLADGSSQVREKRLLPPGAISWYRTCIFDLRRRSLIQVCKYVNKYVRR